MFMFDYNIQMLEEERNSQPTKYRKDYDRDIKELRSIQAKIVALERRVQELNDEAQRAWDRIEY